MTTVISFINLKGGVGKTTSATNLSAAFANAGKKTLLIDLDMQGNASQGFGIHNPEYTIGGAMLNQYALMTYPIMDNLDLVASDMSFSSIEKEIEQESYEDLRLTIGTEFLLKEIIANTKGYDIVLLDCPPSLNFITLNALACSDHVFIPLEAQIYSLEGVKRVIRSIESIKKRINPDVELGGLFFTQYDKRTILSKDLHEEVADMVGGKLLETVIRLNVALKEAPTFKQDIFTYDNKSHGATDYRSLYHEINRIIYGKSTEKKKPGSNDQQDLTSIGDKFDQFLLNDDE